MKKLTRSSVSKRESFLKKLWNPALRVWQVGAKEFKRNQKVLDLLLEIQTRYEHDDDSLALAEVKEGNKKVTLTWEMITQNGKYSLD